jgi:hypothetical protein
MSGPAALVASLLLCTLSETNGLSCRTSDGAPIELREGTRRLGVPTSLGIVHVNAGGFCHLEAPGGTLACFDGAGVKVTLRDTSGRVASFAPRLAVASDGSRVCGIEQAGSVRCFHGSGGEEVVFTNASGSKTFVEGWSRLALGDAILCGRASAGELQCHDLPLSPGLQASRVELMSETGRTYDSAKIAGAEFEVAGRHVCLLTGAPPGLLCFDAKGRRLALKNSAGFATTPRADDGIRLSSTHACALNSSADTTCFLLSAGTPVTFRNSLGFSEAPPSASEVALGNGSEICFFPRSPRPAASPAAPIAAAPACYVDGVKASFKDASGRSVDASKLERPAVRAGRLCGVDVKGSLACFNLSTGRAVTFTNEWGFQATLDAARGVAFGADVVCAISSPREARCARYGGEAVAFRNGFGGSIRIEGVDRLHAAE